MNQMERNETKGVNNDRTTKQEPYLGLCRHRKESREQRGETRQRGEETNHTTTLIHPDAVDMGPPTPPTAAVTNRVLRLRLRTIEKQSGRESAQIKLILGGSMQKSHARIAPKRCWSLIVDPRMPLWRRILTRSNEVTVLAPNDKFDDQKNVF